MVYLYGFGIRVKIYMIIDVIVNWVLMLVFIRNKEICGFVVRVYFFY